MNKDENTQRTLPALFYGNGNTANIKQRIGKKDFKKDFHPMEKAKKESEQGMTVIESLPFPAPI